ncbi:hypothetical protein F4560_000881 [Saccharothrix ecbatanensis]|uniref:Uncharacterized protein n=1 Tax=Saccharothrix ecbatanensis TaxID=1105145 RepID=A0A7W9HFQ3_9PSEU|nr:hypothetical protein [Saccharothrix ecbatanensis]MBB5801113.1 hypothetical protein [Saccharothrix ecbatanensis]
MKKTIAGKNTEPARLDRDVHTRTAAPVPLEKSSLLVRRLVCIR